MTADKKPKPGAPTGAADEVKATPKRATARKPAAKKADAAEKPAAATATPARKPAAKKAEAKVEPTAAQEQPAAVAEAIAEIEKMAAPAKPSAKKTAVKKASVGRIRITQVRSQIGFAQAQRKVLTGLGLGRIGRSVLRHDDPCVRGMVAKVAHLVRVEKVEA